MRLLAQHRSMTNFRDPFWLGIRTADKLFFSVFVMSFCAAPPSPSSSSLGDLPAAQLDPLPTCIPALTSPFQLRPFVDLPIEQCSKCTEFWNDTALPC